jgi:hypothetical protein
MECGDRGGLANRGDGGGRDKLTRSAVASSLLPTELVMEDEDDGLWEWCDDDLEKFGRDLGNGTSGYWS